MSLARQLWAQNQPLAQAARQHPFVRGLAAGSLPRAVFEQYILQDAFFLEAFARAYALALAHAPDRAGLDDFFELIKGALEELRLHATYAARWGLEEQLARVAPSAATLAYTDFLLATAALKGVGETCAALTPCMRLYALLGQSLASEGVADDRNPYAEWVRTYASAEFESLACTLERLLDRYAEPSQEVRAAYARAMQLELAFFDAATR